MVENAINRLLDKVEYWQKKPLMLQAIEPSFYNNKNLVLQLLQITSGGISSTNSAKIDMWNHKIIEENMGDDILQNVSPEILSDKDFIKRALPKYNRTYLFIDKKLQSSFEIARDTALNERPNKGYESNLPILAYMPKMFQEDSEISIIATTRNIDNLQYTTNLKKNKYFLIDIMNMVDDDNIKHKVLKYMDQDLLNDKKFISKLGCFDNMCSNFKNDIEYVSNAVLHDISILKKTEMFDESILVSAMQNDEFYSNTAQTLSIIFSYIEKFNEDYNELNSKIEDKTILHQLFWNMGETIKEEWISL